MSVENAMDISDSINAKSDLSKISNVIKQVYAEGQGSRHTIDINSNKDIKLTIAGNYACSDLKLKDNHNKHMTEYYDSTIKKTSIYLNEGENTLVVEWPMDSENMLIYKK